MRTLQHEDLLQAFAKEKARKGLDSKFVMQLVYYICILVVYIFIMSSLIFEKYASFFLVGTLLTLVAIIILLVCQGKFQVNKDDYLKRKLTIRNNIFRWLTSKGYNLESIKKLRKQIKIETDVNSHGFLKKANKSKFSKSSIIIRTIPIISPAILKVIPSSIIHKLLKYFQMYMINKANLTIFLVIALTAICIVMILCFIYRLLYDWYHGITYYEYILSILDSIIFDLENVGDTIPIINRIQFNYDEELKELK